MSGNGSNHSYSYKTQLCRRFRQGTCSLGSKCTNAYGLPYLRRQQGGIHQEPKACRMSSQYKYRSYGHFCRFLHTQTQTQQFNNAPFDVKLLNPTTKASLFSPSWPTITRRRETWWLLVCRIQGNANFYCCYKCLNQLSGN